MKFIFTISIIFSFLSCAVDKRRNTSELETVNFSQKFHSPKVETGIEGEDIYGPSAEITNDEKEVLSQKQAIVALDFSPALYHSLSYLKLISDLEKKKVNISVVISSGFSAIIAALYGKYKSANRLDWKAYALIKKLEKENKVYSTSWLKTVEIFLKEEFQDIRLEQLKLLVVIPTYDEKNNKLVLKHTGPVVEAIMSSLRIQNSRESFLLNPSIEYFGKEKSFGVDKVFRVSAFPRNFKLETTSGFVLGIYSKLAGLIHYRTDKFMQISDKKLIYIDKVPNMSDLMSLVSDQSEEISLNISNSIQEWANKNN
jgi:hypothetical protein